MSFTLFPSIHLAGGRLVHLVRGEVVAEPVRSDPIKTALWFQEQGAKWIHLLALEREDYHFDPDDVRRIVDTVAIDIQLMTGAVVDDDSLDRALSTGCTRVNLGTAAFADENWCRTVIAEHGDRIGITLPVWIAPHGPRLAMHGRADDGGDLWDVLERFDRMGCARYAVTDIGREGTLSGPNLDLLRQVCARTDAQILAAGGIATLDDLCAVAALTTDGITGALIGRALYADAFTLADANAAVCRP
ncbi:HisA/HisF-related TIM barrel protein [Nocardia sp. NPDC051570]|uniref:HisA/HisF-related TIM barrel protein n=1 Tax=Nocardia sp. NPDC051570 TaxID=3364324 RepID=UPI0037A2DE53